MYLPQNDISEIVLRQRNKKQELSKAINKNRTKLIQVEQEIRFLVQPLDTDYEDECDRLDDEIDKLRRVCQAMLNEIENRKSVNDPTPDQRQLLRPAPPPPAPPQPPPRTRPHNLFSKQPSVPSSLQVSPQSPASLNSHSPMSPSPNQHFLQREDSQPKAGDSSDACDPNLESERWQCSMCTFQNHPSLNVCECCEYVRIEPGSVRILPTRPPPPVPGSRSAPQTPATPAAGPSLVLRHLPNSYNHPSGVTSSNSEGNLPKFIGDVII